MAIPRVFVSSTCYDLGEVRDRLVSFIRTYNFETVLSDKGDVFYHPDLHTHHSCINEVSNCQLFILIIGGRFGGSYCADISKSIVNAEYFAAKECGKPVFTFIKNDVFQNYKLYRDNANNTDIIKKIRFPAIEKQEYAEHIFNFIDEVKNSPVNNGYFTFDYCSEIQDLLSKQWAGMFYDFLVNRERKKEADITHNLLGNITLASKKTEELIEHVYKFLDKDTAPIVIADLDNELKSVKFYNNVYDFFKVSKNFINRNIDDIVELDVKKEWYDFLESTDDFEIIWGTVQANNTTDILTHKGSKMCIVIRENGALVDNKELVDLYDSYRNLSKEKRKKVLHTFIGV